MPGAPGGGGAGQWSRETSHEQEHSPVDRPLQTDKDEDTQLKDDLVSARKYT